MGITILYIIGYFFIGLVLAIFVGSTNLIKLIGSNGAMEDVFSSILVFWPAVFFIICMFLIWKLALGVCNRVYEIFYHKRTKGKRNDM